MKCNGRLFYWCCATASTLLLIQSFNTSLSKSLLKSEHTTCNIQALGRNLRWEYSLLKYITLWSRMTEESKAPKIFQVLAQNVQVGHSVSNWPVSAACPAGAPSVRLRVLGVGPADRVRRRGEQVPHASLCAVPYVDVDVANGYCETCSWSRPSWFLLVVASESRKRKNQMKVGQCSVVEMEKYTNS